jgi:hypothetical protein
MKAGELTDETIQNPNARIVVEMPNGQRVATIDYYHTIDPKGNGMIVITAGRKL